jgi:hypothetical protein
MKIYIHILANLFVLGACAMYGVVAGVLEAG